MSAISRLRLFTQLSAVFLLIPAPSSMADVWKWVDPLGNTRYVETLRPVFTWVVDGKVFFSDLPAHEDAIAVQLVWHSRGNIADLDENGRSSATDEPETPEEAAVRLEAEKKYCKRITEIHDSYVNAPRMYRVNEQKEREYLSDGEIRKAIREISAVKKSACK